jgi:hypothetical protein
MKLYAITSTIMLIGSLGSAPVSMPETFAETQTITIPDRDISFDRGSYKIIEFKYDRKYQLTEDELHDVLTLAGFSGSGLRIAKKIVFLESTNRPMALNSSSNCYGLFQINMTGSMGPDRREKYGLQSNEDLYNPLTNARIAFQMSNGGKNWSAWSTADAATK